VTAKFSENLLYSAYMQFNCLSASFQLALSYSQMSFTYKNMMCHKCSLKVTFTNILGEHESPHAPVRSRL